ncbi:MAG: hypothetical protein RLZZ01_2182 [Actinomycetota bacterium]
MPPGREPAGSDRIAVVIVTYAGDPAMLSQACAAVDDAGGAEWTIVVDTGGRARLDGVEIVRMPNRGYGAAANLGARLALDRGATAVAVLNDDVVVRPGWLAPLVTALRNGAGVAQPKLVLAGTDPAVVNSLGVVLDQTWQGHDIGDGLVDGGPGTLDGGPIGIFSGGAVLCSDAFLFATGGFDERYVLYYEDVDLALRGRALGWGFEFVPESVVEHVRGATTGGTPDRTRYLQERNRLWCAARFAPVSGLMAACWLSVRRLRHRPRLVHARALAAGTAGMPVRLVERRRGVLCRQPIGGDRTSR